MGLVLAPVFQTASFRGERGVRRVRAIGLGGRAHAIDGQMLGTIQEQRLVFRPASIFSRSARDCCSSCGLE